MAKTKGRGPLAELRVSVRRMQREGERLVGRIQRDTKALIKRSRAEVVNDVHAVQREVRRRADRTVRDFEARVVKQFHAATASRVARLEQRIAELERRMKAVESRTAGVQAA